MLTAMLGADTARNWAQGAQEAEEAQDFWCPRPGWQLLYREDNRFLGIGEFRQVDGDWVLAPKTVTFEGYSNRHVRRGHCVK